MFSSVGTHEFGKFLELFWKFPKKIRRNAKLCYIFIFFLEMSKLWHIFGFFLEISKNPKKFQTMLYALSKQRYIYICIFFHTFMYTYKKITLYLHKLIVCRTLQLPCRNSWFLFVYVIVLWAFIMFYDLYAFDHMQSTQAQLPMQQLVGSNFCCSSLN